MNSSLSTSSSATKLARVLVLDRDPATHLFVRSSDPNVPYEVRQTTLFEETDAAIIAFRPDIVIMASDWLDTESSDAPGTRYVELLAMFRKADRNLPVIVLVVTGSGVLSTISA